MATRGSCTEQSQGDGADTLNTRPQATDRVADDHAAWLVQATKVRDEALRLMHERFIKDLEDVTQLVGGNDPIAFRLQVEYADKLTAGYLAESERLFDLMNKLGEDGLLEIRQNL